MTFLEILMSSRFHSLTFACLAVVLDTLYNTQNTDNSVYHRQKMALIRFSFWNCELKLKRTAL